MMIQDKIKQSFKNMRGGKSYLLINIGGLSIAFAVFILIMLFVLNEFNFDKFNTNGNRVYRIEEGEHNQVPMSISRVSKQIFPEVENSVMIKSTNNHWISYEKNFFEIKDFCFAENSFFEMFSVPFVLGDPNMALNEPFTIVLAESLATQKQKEIFIRKVNGAQISEVLVMLNKDFLKWVTLAFIVAVPIAYFILNKCLENFSYKTSLSWWIFALSGLLAFLIALLTVSLQSLIAARRNPIEALRYE